MTPEELLKPRFKVKPFPFMATHGFYPDKIIVLDKRDSEQWYVELPEGKFYDAWFAMFDCFEKLEWWDERDESEMPEYVSYVSLTKKGRIYGDAKQSEDNFYKARVFEKVTSWAKKQYSGFFSGKKIKEWYYNNNSFSTLCPSHLPATKEEYESFISKIRQPIQ